MQAELSDILQAYAEGRYSQQRTVDAIYHTVSNGTTPNFCRVVILDVIHDPMILTEELKSHYVHNLNISNSKYINVLPRNTIIAKKLLADSTDSEQAMFLFPFFPSHISMPCKPGEHVWAFFESSSVKDIDIGWWMWRTVTLHHTDDPNHSHQPRDLDQTFYLSQSTKSLANGDKITYDFLNGVGNTDENGKRFAIANSRCITGSSDEYEKILTQTNASQLCEYESVPRYKKRPDELCFEGSNNTLISLGTDRIDAASVSNLDSTQEQITEKRNDKEIKGHGTGRIDVVVGRGQTSNTSGVAVKNSLGKKELGKSSDELTQHEGDIDYKNDRSRILLSGKTLVDVNFGLDGFNKATFLEEKIQDRGESEQQLTSDKCGDGAIVAKSDKIRFVARSDQVFYVTSYSRDENGNMVEIDDISKWAAIAIRTNGDIVLKLGESGVFKIGDDTADRGMLVSGVPCTVDRTSGKVSGPSPVTTNGGALVTGQPLQGMWADRILVKGS